MAEQHGGGVCLCVYLCVCECACVFVGVSVCVCVSQCVSVCVLARALQLFSNGHSHLREGPSWKCPHFTGHSVLFTSGLGISASVASGARPAEQ